MTDRVPDLQIKATTSKDGKQLLFVACFIALVATSFAFIIRVMLMDAWQIDFNLSETQKGEIFGAGMWPFGLSIVLFSLVIDRIGYGKSMIFAFVCHVASAILMVMANGYWMLYLGSILNGLAAGTVEAVINPAVASMYPKRKTTMLTTLHAGWPGGFVLGGIALLLMGGDVTWKLKVGIILIPVVAYGLLLLKAKFPPSERVVAGVSYKDMLKEAGAIGCLIVVYMILMEINRVLGLGNILDTSFFDLPSWPMTIALVVLVGAYLAYTKTLGRGMYIFLLLIMILLAITELGTDTWIKELMGPAMKKIGINSGWVLVYTATIMMILRFCIGPIERLLRPLGVLFVSALFAAAGLYFLSGAEGVWILITATIYGTGQCFFWPVTLGLVSERFPRGGALTLNAIGGVGMLGVGIIGSQLLGFWQDTDIDAELQAKQQAAYKEVMDPASKTSIFGTYRSLDTKKVNAIEDKAALYDRRQEVVKTLTEETGEAPDAKALAKALREDGKYGVLVRNAFDHLKPAEPPKPGEGATPATKMEYEAKKKAYDLDVEKYAAVKTYEQKLAYLASHGMLVAEDAYKGVKESKDLLDKVRGDAKRSAMARVAILPLIMAACYLGLILYFKSKGGYKAVELTAGGEVAGEHPVATKEAVADAEATPSE